MFVTCFYAMPEGRPAGDDRPTGDMPADEAWSPYPLVGCLLLATSAYVAGSLLWAALRWAAGF